MQASILNADFIQKYFKSCPDKSLDDSFRQGAGFFNSRNCIHAYERIDKDQIRIYFKDRKEYRDQVIMEDGVRAGIATLVTPHTVQIRSGAFICSGVKKVVERPVVNKWRKVDLTISKKIWSKGLCIVINNKHLNVSIECDSIYPDSFSSETINSYGIHR